MFVLLEELSADLTVLRQPFSSNFTVNIDRNEQLHLVPLFLHILRRKADERKL